MKTRKPNPQAEIVKHLSPGERKVFHTGIRNREKFWRRMKRLRAAVNGSKRTFLFALCVGLFLAGNVAKAQPGFSAPALFNEANAAQHAGRLGPAILGYERASLLAPGDPAIAKNLRAAREKASVAAPVVPAWQRPAHALSLDGLAVLASVSLLLVSLLLFGARLIPATQRNLIRGVAASFGVIALLAGLSVVVRWPELTRAVIVGARSTARIAPAGNAEKSFDLKSGELVQAGKRYGQFVLVRSADGRSGWVSREEVESIIPSGT
jgi:hypothetical protein